MNRGNILRRPERLEETTRPPERWKYHTIMGKTDEELEAKKAELMASPEWSEGDNLIMIHFVDHGSVDDSLICRRLP